MIQTLKQRGGFPNNKLKSEKSSTNVKSNMVTKEGMMSFQFSEKLKMFRP
jgi:hypothetical protein